MQKIVDGVTYVTTSEYSPASCKGCIARYEHGLCGSLCGELTTAEYACGKNVWVLASDKKPATVTVPTDTLNANALDWAVAKYRGYVHKDGNVYLNDWQPHSNWTQTGAIIETEELSLKPVDGGWRAVKQGFCEATGPTPLVAALRCFVRLWAGPEIAVPKHLVKYA